MNIEALLPGDIVEVRGLQPQNMPDILPKIELYLCLPFCHSFKMTEGNKICAIGTAILYETTAWLAHVIVHEHYRNRGLGTLMLDHLCGYCRQNKYDTTLLFATEMGYPVYKKYGFQVQTEYAWYERETPLEDIAHPNIYRPADTDLEGMLDLDRYISGEDRRNLLQNYLLQGFVYKKGTEVTGFYLPEAGEGVIIALDEEAGTELMRLRLRDHTQAVLPVENTQGASFLMANGFMETKKGKRMVYGHGIVCKNEHIYNRIGGNFG
jgi:GNAT superfamily N-acetyltransferase